MKRIELLVVTILTACSFMSAQTDYNSNHNLLEINRPTTEDRARFELWKENSVIPNRSYPQGNTLQDPIAAGSYSTDFFYTDTKISDYYDDNYGVYGPDIFYTFSLAVPMNVTLTHQGSDAFDTYMHLLDSSGNLIESNNDYDGIGHCDNILLSFIQRQLPAGTYYVVSEGNCCVDPITTNITGYASSSYGYSSIPSAYSTDPNTAVGGMGSQFGVSSMGGATYSIPIEVPVGVGGLQPQLSIVYNSQAGNGLCGYGTNLSGFSSITRGPKNIYHDNSAQGVNYLDDDALFLDGVRLILDSLSVAGQNGAIYYPESDPFTHIIEHVSSSPAGIWFEEQNRNGQVCVYGYNDNSRLSYNKGGVNKIHSWYLYSVQQPNGNLLTCSYQKDNNCIYPYQITYGSNYNANESPYNLIEFTYENRTDTIPVRFDGQKGRMNKRLKTITSKTNGNIFRTYTLNYNTTGDGTTFKYSRLEKVTEKNAQNENRPYNRFIWSYLPSVSYQSYTPSILSISSEAVSIGDQNLSSGDFNGDGIDDIFGYKYTGSGKNGLVHLYKYMSGRDSNGNVVFNDTAYYSFTPSYSSVSGDYPYYFSYALGQSGVCGSSTVDYNGDGNNEFLLGHRHCMISVGVYPEDTIEHYMSFYMIDSNNNRFGTETLLYTNCSPLYATGDVDNDGRTDIVVLETERNNWGLAKIHLLSQSVDISQLTLFNIFDEPISYSIDYNLYLSSDPERLYLTDMNGNGLKDMVVVCENNYTIYWNQGGSISSSMFSDYHKTTRSDFDYWKMTATGDFNGDGLMDFLTTAIDSSSWKFFINNGDGTFNKINACTLNLFYQSFTTRDYDKFHCDVFDFDGDGKDDVVITKAVYERESNWWGEEWGEFDKTHTYWMRSTGTSLEQVYHATSNKVSDSYPRRFVSGDFDGDGRIELVNYGYNCVSGINSNSDPEWRIYKNLNFSAQTGKVTSITGDYGAMTSITYATLTDTTVYTSGAKETYPAPRYTIPLNVVKQTVQNNGAAGSLTTRYSYEGLKTHLCGRGILGFAKTVANCTTTGIKTESGIIQWDTLHYIPKVTYTKTMIGSSLSQTTNSLTIVSKGGKKYFAYPLQIEDIDMDGNSVITVNHFNAVFGYQESDTTYYGTNMYRATDYTDYIFAGGTYRPQTVVQTQRHSDDASPYIRTTTYTYNNTTGSVSTMIENYGTIKPLTTTYSYDQYGNLASQVSTGSGIQTPCTTFYQYESTHRFPVRIFTYPSSSVQKYTYDIWGNILTEQDSINLSINNTVTHTYDAWGDLIRTQTADGSVVTYTRGWNNSFSQRWFVLEQGTALPWVKTWYDNHGRQVKTESIGPQNISVNSTTTYNNKGLTTSRIDVNGDLTLTYNYTYDSRSRLTQESAPGNHNITYQYGNRTVTITENGNRTSTKTFDAWGNLKTLTAPISSLTNTYASSGGIKTTVSGGSTWTFQYDDRGNRTSMTDPDAGTTTYSYDAMSRETQRIDGRGVVFVTNYDYLGRVITESATQSGSTQTITHTYGTSGTGQMRLTSESLGSWTKSYEYDAYGRVTSETMTNGTDITRSKAYQYDSNGQLSQKTLPGSVTNSYTYDSYGNLTGVSGASGAIVWSLNQYTGRRAVTHTILDNYTIYPLLRTTTLDQYGYPDTIKTSQYGYYYQIDNYGFSAQTGNLMAMKQKGMDNPMYYNYDNVDRLTSVQIGNQNLMYITYATNGNITSKSDIGSYTYSSTTKPHAVQSVQNTNNEIDYNEQSITYNQWGKVDNIWQTDNTDFYYYFAQYGPDLKKVYSTMDKTYHREYDKFFWGDYEEKTVNGVTTRYYYVSGADGLVGLHTEKDAPSGTVTNSYAIITDHLGSITMMVDNYDDYNEIRYDPWGNRTVQESFLDEVIDRGYTGHEHLDQLGLIDMKGRMYDSRLGRFLSPDPFVQAPTDPQNFNRYSYCLNNPLKYTDPSGESIIAAIIIGAIVSSAVDYSMQVVFNYFSGYSGKDAWFKKVDFFDIAVSGVFGGFTAGCGTAAKTGSRLGKWVIKNGNAIRNSEIVLTSAVDITGEGVQKVSGNQIVSRMAIGLATQAVSDAVVNYSKKTNNNNLKVENQTNETAVLSNRPRNLKNDGGGKHSVYRGIDKTGNVKYVGITSREPTVRWNEHFRSNTSKSSLRFESIPNSFGLSRTNARIWEQTLINQYGLDNLYNKINSISPINWNQFNIK